MPEAAGDASLLEVRDLEGWYGESKALHGVSFGLGKGELVPLVGRNGAGKTSTLRAIVGLLRKRAGEILLVEQNFRFAAKLADRFCVVENGRVVDVIERRDLAASEQKIYAYLGV